MEWGTVVKHSPIRFTNCEVNGWLANVYSFIVGGLMRIRASIVGLQSVFWPHAFANCLNSIWKAELAACASIG